MTHHIQHLSHTMTLWQRVSGGYNSAEVFSPDSPNGGVRWTPKKRESKFSKEQDRASAPGSTVLVQTPVAVGDIVALGDHNRKNPEDVEGIHEVVEYRETPNLFDTYTVMRAMVKPLIGQLEQIVTVYPMVRVVSGRSYTVERQPSVYSGKASVDMSPWTRTQFADAPVVEGATIVTVPYFVDLSANTRYEIEWVGPFGTVILDSVGIIFNNQDSPFWKSLNCTLRKPQTSDGS